MLSDPTVHSVARKLQREDHVTAATHAEPRLLRLYLGLFALVALSMLLAASWLRGWVPVRQAVRVRDVNWLPPGGR
ncbi:hypothetical protein AMYX_37560 [Anaeromyxobacter diazotrophicus]|uniref:Uncharacterized protein n=1 Tax=Anaeromyxobacter diazotrophicus TaxID=2590199 RepID=A0A7I9VRG8_9BACT|nr:hypothetical protein AMYX_37560 [Anaeromyxobacter diazotrophicus]